MKKLLIFFLLQINLYSLDFVLGLGNIEKSLEIYEKDSLDVIAEMRESSYYPIIGLRTSPNYFDDGESNAGYFIEIDFSLLDINKQVVSENDEEETNLDTSIEGYSIYIIPTFYYDFIKESKYSFKIGGGLGLGYLNIKGNYKITKETHNNYNTTYDIDIHNLDLAISFLIEYKINNHYIIAQDCAIDHSEYEIDKSGNNQHDYLQHNLSLMYKYFISFN